MQTTRRYWPRKIDTDGISEEETDKQECLIQEWYQTTALDFIMQGNGVERFKNEG